VASLSPGRLEIGHIHGVFAVGYFIYNAVVNSELFLNIFPTSINIFGALVAFYDLF